MAQRWMANAKSNLMANIMHVSNFKFVDENKDKLSSAECVFRVRALSTSLDTSQILNVMTCFPCSDGIRDGVVSNISGYITGDTCIELTFAQNDSQNPNDDKKAQC